MNPTISPSTIKEYLGRIMQYGWQGNASTAWDSRDPADAEDIAGYTGASAAYGDKLITLSTCEYSQTNGRMVVVAKKISSPPVEVDRNEA